MITRCPRQYYYRYIQEWKEPPGAALEFGKAYHKTLEESFRADIAGYGHFSAGLAETVFADEFDRHSKNVEWSSESTSKGTLMDKGTDLVGQYVCEFAPRRKATDVEVEFTVQIPEVDEPFVGYIDLIADDYLLDHKTAARAWSAGRLASTMQVEAYYLAYRALTGRYPRQFVYDIAVKTKAPYIQFDLQTKRTTIQLDLYVQRIRDARDMVEKELFPRTNPDNWSCSPKWCGYYDHCIKGVPMSQLRVTNSNSEELLGDGIQGL